MPAGPGIGNDNVVGSAWVNLGVNPKKFNQGLAMAGGKLSKFAAIAAPLAVGVGLAIGFKKATSAAAEFGQAMAMVKAVTLSGVKDLEKQGQLFDMLSAKAKLIGKTTKWQMTEIAAGMENLGRAGFSAVEVMEAIAGVSDLAASQMMDLSSAADITAMILRSMNMEASRSVEIADMLAYAASNSAARVEGLGDSYKYVGALAAAFGTSAQLTTAMMMKLADAGIRGSMAGTSLRMAFSELLGMTSAFRLKLKGVGISMKDVTKSSGKMKGFAEILGVFAEKGLGAADMIALFGKRAGPSMAILLREGQTAIEEYTNALDNAGGTAQDMRKIMEDTLSGQITILSGSWNLLLTTIGEKATPILQDMVQNAIIPMVNAMVDWAEKSGNVEAAMSGIANTLKNTMVWISKNGAKTIGVIKGLGIAILSLSAAKTIVGLAALIKKLKVLKLIMLGWNPYVIGGALFLGGAAGLYKMGKAIYDGLSDGIDVVQEKTEDLIHTLSFASAPTPDAVDWATTLANSYWLMERTIGNIIDMTSRADYGINFSNWEDAATSAAEEVIAAWDRMDATEQFWGGQFGSNTTPRPVLQTLKLDYLQKQLEEAYGSEDAKIYLDVYLDKEAMLAQLEQIQLSVQNAPSAAVGQKYWDRLMNEFLLSWIDTYPELGKLIRTNLEEDVAAGILAGIISGIGAAPELFQSFVSPFALPGAPENNGFGPRVGLLPEPADVTYLQTLKDNITGADGLTEAMRLAREYVAKFGDELQPMAEATEEAGSTFAWASVEMAKSLSETLRTAEERNAADKAFGRALTHSEADLLALRTMLGLVEKEADAVAINFRKLSDKMSTFGTAFGKASNLLLGDELGGNLSAVFGIIQKQAKANEMKQSAAGMEAGSAEQMAAMDAAGGGQAAAAAAVIELIVELIEQGVQFVKDQLTSAGETAMAFAQSIWGAITATEAWSDMMDGLQSAMSRLMNAILSPLMLLGELFRILGGKVIEVTDAISDQTQATEESMSDLNVPTSWREDRVRWAAIRPGETPRDYTDDIGETTQDGVDQELSWLEQAIEQFRGLFQHHLDWFGDFVDRMQAIGVQLFPAFLEILEGPLTTFEHVMDDIASWIEDVFAEDFKAFASGFHEWWTTDVDPFLQEDVFKFFGDAFKDVYEWIGSTFLPFLKNEFWPAFKTDVWPAIEAALTQLGGALSDLFTTVDDNMPTITQFLTEFFTGIISKWTGMVETVNAYTLTKAGDLAGGLKVIWESESLSLWEKTKASFGLGAIAVWDWFVEALEPLKEPFRKLGEALRDLWEQIAPVLIPVFKILGEIIGGWLIYAINGLTLSIKLFGLALDLVGFVIKGILNGIIFAMNALIWGVNLFLPKKMDIPYIPYLEKGGDILGTGIAVVHAGESVLDTAMAQSAMAGAGAGGGEVHVYLGSEEVTDMVVTEVRRESGRKYGKTHTSKMFRGR